MIQLASVYFVLLVLVTLYIQTGPTFPGHRGTQEKILNSRHISIKNHSNWFIQVEILVYLMIIMDFKWHKCVFINLEWWTRTLIIAYPPGKIMVATFSILLHRVQAQFGNGNFEIIGLIHFFLGGGGRGISCCPLKLWLCWMGRVRGL